jgi:hypothetical protein
MHSQSFTSEMNVRARSTFHPQPFDADDRKLATLIWGITLGIGTLTAVKAVEQTLSISRRIGFSKSIYLWMVWILYIDNFIASVIMWLQVNGTIKARLDVIFRG